MDGFVLIDKPAGMTSHDVVDAVRKIAKTRRVGHAGTLDPFATGLLILGLNRATKKLGDLVGLHKEYVATARLGETSTTDDPEGKISRTTTNNPRPTIKDIETAVKAFLGTYTQTAPAYSAKKVGGKKLYELARKGKADEVERPTKDVTIHEIEILSYEWPELTFRVRCSSGTYIRALTRDIGKTLEIGAYLTNLRRTHIGSFHIEDAVALSDLNERNIESRII